MNNLYIASVIIPTYNRDVTLDRAIRSVLEQQGSDLVEIIVIDDMSQFKKRPSLLRKSDKYIYNEVNVGAAVSRNIGIEMALGKWVFLLDSDDYYIDVNFLLLNSLDHNALYFSQVISGKKNVEYPSKITETDFFDFIFNKYKGIAQTSSLFFYKELGLKFDESLPKHQDWDFVYTQCLKDGVIEVRKSPFKTFFDKSDKRSLSRVYSSKKSIPWIEKLDLIEANSFIKFRLLGASKDFYSFYEFSKEIFFGVIGRKILMIDALKLLYRRFFCVE